MRYMQLVLVGLFFIPGAFALDVPRPSKYDGRIKYVNYNAGDVVVVHASIGMGGRIVFSKEEEILDVASGFTQGWEFKNRRNILFIKPRSVNMGEGQSSTVMMPEPVKWNTNLMVTTTTRMYDFDLILLRPGETRNVSYRVEFRYPNEEKDKTRKAAAQAMVKTRMNQKAPPRNWAYTMQVGKHSEEIAPTMAYDDGRFTYLQFPGNREFPSIFTVAADKQESIVNTHVDQDTLVVHRVAKEMVIRLDKMVVGLYNEAYDPAGLPPTAGTSVPGVERILLEDH